MIKSNPLSTNRNVTDDYYEELFRTEHQFQTRPTKTRVGFLTCSGQQQPSSLASDSFNMMGPKKFRLLLIQQPVNSNKTCNGFMIWLMRWSVVEYPQIFGLIPIGIQTHQEFHQPRVQWRNSTTHSRYIAWSKIQCIDLADWFRFAMPQHNLPILDVAPRAISVNMLRAHGDVFTEIPCRLDSE